MVEKKKVSNTCTLKRFEDRIYCRHRFKDINEIPDSNELLNAFLIILGLFYVYQAIISFIGMFFPLPEYLVGVLIVPGARDVLSVLASLGTYQIIVGAGALISGIGLNAEQEWAWGMGLIVLVFIAIASIQGIINIVLNGSFLSIGFLIHIICAIASILGIFWLLGTKERYY